MREWKRLVGGAGALALLGFTVGMSGLRAQAQQELSQQEQSQQPQLKVRTQEQQPAISVEVKTVSVLATVRDKHGKIIRGLKKEDFQLDEDGRPQKIDYWTHESDLPLRLGLLVDTSLSQRKVLEDERAASYSFLDRLLRENKDMAFVLHFDHQVELLQDFTASRPRLQSALQQLSIAPSDAGSSSGGHGGGGGSGYPGGGGQRRGRMHGGGTQLYDAIFLGADELMSKQQGRKAMIVLSDGVDRGSKETMGEAMAAAERGDTILYCIYFADEDEGGFGDRGFGRGGHGGYGRPGGGRPPQEARPDGKKTLEQISEQTGGRLFKASKKETLEKIYAEIDEDLRNQYSLAYTPDKGNTIGYHKIHLTVPGQKDVVVTARDGYYYGQ